MLSDVQKRKFSRLFALFDTDRNGCVDRADYERIAHSIAETGGHGPGSPRFVALTERYERAWEALNAPDDLGVNSEEWLAYHEKLLVTPGAYEDTLGVAVETVFDALDADGDGKITEDEWRQFFRAYSIDESLVDRCFPRFDLDRDGYVSRAEASDLVAQFYFSSDPDAPGNWLFGEF